MEEFWKILRELAKMGFLRIPLIVNPILPDEESFYMMHPDGHANDPKHWKRYGPPHFVCHPKAFEKHFLSKSSRVEEEQAGQKYLYIPAVFAVYKKDPFDDDDTARTSPS